MPTQTVNLGNQGLAPGDDIAPYLDDFWTSGTEVVIPAGEYNLSTNAAFSFDGSDSILRGDGGMVRINGQRTVTNPGIFARGGTVTIKHVTIHNDPSLGGLDIGVSNGARLEFLNFNFPDGHTPEFASETLPAFLNRRQANGTVVWDSCNVFGWSEPAIYTGQSQNCTNIVRNCWLRRNNIDQIRCGGTGDVIEQNLIEMPTPPPADAEGQQNGRGIRVRYPDPDTGSTAGSVTIRNNKITYDDPAAPILIKGNAATTIEGNDVSAASGFAMYKTGDSQAPISGGGNVLTGAATELNAPLSGLYSTLIDCPPTAGGDGSVCPRIDDPRQPLQVDDGGTANQAPTASFTASPSSPSVGEAVTFDASGSTDPDGSITGYSWAFDDGSTGSGATVTHTYDAADDYSVALTVTDDAGATGSTTQTVSVGPGGEGASESSLGPLALALGLAFVWDRSRR